MELGILKIVSPRLKWQYEARTFTPWLAENIGNLNKALGLDLVVENIEVACGPFSADILAKDTGTDKYVVIENQLERTNHDHLGKAITYASVLDASTIVWVATDFTQEHSKALDWLNDHTNDEISFYGVQVELWQIDDSKPALRFNIVSKPNEAVRQATKAKANEEMSDLKKFQLDFWTKLRDRLQKTKRFSSLQTPRPHSWYDMTLGRAHIHLSNTCTPDQNTVGIKIYISNRIADIMLPYLESKKDEIEKSIGQSLNWNPYPMSRDKTIVLNRIVDFDDKNKIEDALNWLVEYDLKFRDTFSKIILQAPLVTMNKSINPIVIDPVIE